MYAFLGIVMSAANNNNNNNNNNNKYLLESQGLFPEEQKRWRKRIRETNDLLFIGICILKETKTRKKILAMSQMDSKNNSHDPVNVDNRMSENVQDIRKSYKVHHKTCGKLESRIISRRTYTCRGKNPKRHLSGRLIFNTTIFYSNSELYTEEMQRRFTKSQEKINHPHVCG